MQSSDELISELKNQIREYVAKNGYRPKSIEVSRSEFADLLVEGWALLLKKAALVQYEKYQFMGIELEVKPDEEMRRRVA